MSEDIKKTFAFKRLMEILEKLPEDRQEAFFEFLEREVKKEQFRVKRFYSPKEFADELGIPVERVRRWLREGILKGKKISRSWLIPHSELEKILEFEDD